MRIQQGLRKCSPVLPIHFACPAYFNECKKFLYSIDSLLKLPILKMRFFSKLSEVVGNVFRVVCGEFFVWSASDISLSPIYIPAAVMFLNPLF